MPTSTMVLKTSRIVLLAAVSICCYQSPPPVSHMWWHYEEVATLQMAVIAGDLESAQAYGRQIAEHETMQGLPMGSEPFVLEMRSQAERITVAPDIQSAASAVGSMGRTCAACHLAYNVQARLEHGGTHDLTEEAGSSDIGQHVTAADHLWDGLVGPSDSMWTAGARGLENVPWLEGRVSGRREAVTAANELAQDLRALGRAAAMITDSEERAETYGAVLSRCAQCHGLAGAEGN